MQPANPWSGFEEVSGGYIAAKSSGEVVAYHMYNRNLFEEYLLHNTHLERASSSRHDFYRIYEEEGQLFIKLNLQIRFKPL